MTPRNGLKRGTGIYRLRRARILRARRVIRSLRNLRLRAMTISAVYAVWGTVCVRERGPFCDLCEPSLPPTDNDDAREISCAFYA